MLNDPLAAVLVKIVNAERVGKKEIVFSPVSKVIKQVLALLNEHHYVGSFEESKDGEKEVLKVHLLGNINKCGAIKPRFSVKKAAYEKWEKRYLPAKNFGVLLLTTPQGIMTHTSAKEKQIGGKLLAYCY